MFGLLRISFKKYNFSLKNKAMSNFEEIIKKHEITLKYNPINEIELQQSRVLIIRHAYSEYNFKAQETRLIYGEESPEFQQLISDPQLHDPGLHEIGIK